MDDRILLDKVIESFDFSSLTSEDNIGLLTGSSGSLLFLVLYSMVTENNSIEEKAEQVLDDILGKLAEAENSSPSHCEGIAGIAWSLLFLYEIHYLNEPSDDFFDDCDRLLTVYLDLFLKEEKWDLLYGAIGIGFYFLKRSNEVEVKKIIKFLERIAVSEDNQIKFKRHEPYFERLIYDTGFAHGNAAVLLFVTRAYKAGILLNECKTLISGMITFYDKNVHKYDVEGCYWPDFMEMDNSIKDQQTYSRIAWCYGDLMILNTLYTASEAIGDIEGSIRYLDMLEVTSGRTSYTTSLVKDPHICHGSAGIALVYEKLYHSTSRKAFKLAADYWISVTISAFVPGSVLGDQTSVHSLPFIDENKNEFLDGLAGVGLVALSRVYREKFQQLGLNSWTQMVFLF